MECRLQRCLAEPSDVSARSAPHAGRAVLSVAFDSSGRFALTGRSKDVMLWNASTGALIQSYPDPTGYEITSVAPTANGDLLASCADKMVVLWDVARAQVTRRFSCLQRANCATFLSEEILGVGTYDQEVRLYDLRQTKRAPVQVLKGAKDSVSDLLWLPHSSILIAASIEGAVRSYDVRQGLLNVDNVGAPVSSVSVTNDKECLLVSCLDERLRLLSLGDGEVLNAYAGHKNESYKLDCGVVCDDSVVGCGSEDGRLWLWDLAAEEDSSTAVTLKVSGDSTPVCAVAAHPTEPVLLVGGHNGLVHLYKVRGNS